MYDCEVQRGRQECRNAGDHKGSSVEPPRPTQKAAACCSRRRGAGSECDFSLFPAASDEPVAHMAALVRRAGSTRPRNNMLSDFRLRAGGVMRQLLDRLAITVAGVEIHSCID